MKKLLLSAALAGTVMLGGCATTGGLSPDAKDAIAQAQAAAVQLCAYLPTFQTAQNIIVAAAYPAGTPVATIANQVGDAICAAVTAKSARLGQNGPTVRGVRVFGRFVK